MANVPARLSPIVELRQYDLHPRTRETLIDVFDTHFIEGQEREGMAIIGQFRDLDNADSFVWLRGFEDMETRRKALTAFYSGPVWMAQRDRANATMVRFDNVLLLRPAWPGGEFALDLSGRPPFGTEAQRGGLISVNMLTVRGNPAEFAAWYRANMLPLLLAAGGDVVGAFITHEAENTYPPLPVRADKRVFVLFSRFADVATLDALRKRLAETPAWAEATKAAGAYVQGPPQPMRLSPTARSALAG